MLDATTLRQLAVACAAAAVATAGMLVFQRRSSGDDPPRAAVAQAPVPSPVTTQKSTEPLPSVVARRDPAPAVPDTTASIPMARADAVPRAASPASTPGEATPAPPETLWSATPSDPESNFAENGPSGNEKANGVDLEADLAARMRDLHQPPPRRPDFAALAEPPAPVGVIAGSEPAAVPSAAPKPDSLGAAVRTSAATPTECIPQSLRGALREAAAKFGPITLVSTTTLHSHNHASGSARAKMHANCQAVDFRPPEGKLKAMVAYLRSRRDLGGIEGYRDGVIHIDARDAPQVANRRSPKAATPPVEEGDAAAE